MFISKYNEHSTTHSWTISRQRGQAADIVFLDFTKAFDKVPGKRLLRKLRAHGIGGKLYSWIKAWLTGRQQRVVRNGDFSDWAAVLSGVPQGSVLGSVSDPDPDSGVFWIRLRIPNPDPGL